MFGYINASRPASTASTATRNAFRTGSTRGLPMVLAAIALTVAGSLMADNFEGGKPHREARLAKIKHDAAMDDVRFGWGRWNSMPFMDRWAHRTKRFFLYGPMDLRIRWNEFKIFTGDMISSAFQNILPLGIGLAALYAGLGPDKVNGWVGRGFDAIFRKQWLSDGLKKDLCRMAGSAFKPVKDGLAGMGRWTTRSGPNFIFTLGALAAGAFALNRFRDVYKNEAGDQFMRSSFSQRDNGWF